MNARDKIKPKSIRVAILSALADGAITTIDDLQTTLDVPRKKVVDNAVHAANDNLIKRMRDDVTGLAAYQITATGREYLKLYANSNAVEPSLPETPVCAESQSSTITPRVKAESVVLGVLDTAMPGVTAEVVAQKDAEIARLNRMFVAACADLDLINERLGLDPNDGGAEPIIDAINEISEELKTVRAELELSRLAHKSEDPALYVLQRPAKPLARFTKLISAETRAMAFAKGGQRAQVFALTLVGTAVPGAEWRKA